MALNWDASKIKDVDTLHRLTAEEEANKDSRTEPVSGQEWRITESLIWATMAIGMPSITEKNAREFAIRIAAFESAFGPFLYRINEYGSKRSLLTFEAIERRIGLYTNASSLTAAQFRKKVIDRLMREAEEEVRYQERAQTATA